MKSSTQDVFSSDPPPILLKRLTVRVLTPDDYPCAGELLDREHYLGDLPAGRQLLQAVEYEGRWVALLDWGPASLKLAEREEWIGWTAQQRAERLSLIVLNRRFLVLGRTRMPNLASKSLALATQALPDHWEQAHGYRPVLAETFSDIELHEGTCYKAANWTPCGHTQGFGRHRADYYRRHGRPKKLWLKTLNRNAQRILTAMDPPPGYRAALNQHSPERDLPLQRGQLESLFEHLHRHLADPRRANRSFRCASLLVLVAMALFAGRDNLAAIQRYGQFLTQAQRGWLRFPVKKDSGLRKTPSYTALRNLLTQLDPHDFAACLNRWLQAHFGTLPRALAVDGKWIRDRALSLCLSEHHTGAPVALGFAQPKTTAAPAQSQAERKREGEQSIALRLYATTALENATVTGDALNYNQAQAHAIIAGGGDYFLQLKNENRHSYQAALQTAKGPPFLSTPKNPTSATAVATSAG